MNFVSKGPPASGAMFLCTGLFFPNLQHRSNIAPRQERGGELSCNWLGIAETKTCEGGEREMASCRQMAYSLLSTPNNVLTNYKS